MTYQPIPSAGGRMRRSTLVLLAVTVAAWLGVAILALLISLVGGQPALEPVRLN